MSLAASGHVLVAPSNAGAAIAAATDALPDIAILDPGFGNGTRWSLVPALRDLASPSRVWVIGNIPGVNGRQYAEAWEAGVDDVIRRSAPPEEIRGRVGVLTRVLGWAHREAPVALDLRTLRTYMEVDGTFLEELSEMFGVPLAVTVPNGVDRAAAVVLTLAAKNQELGISVGVDVASSHRLTEIIYGGPVASEVVDDTLREVANLLGGAFKRAALSEGHVFTLGVPLSCGPFVATAEEHSFGLAGGGLTFTLKLWCRTGRPRSIPARDLRSGMVLAQDIRSAQGALLLATGTGLTVRTSERVVELLGAATVVLVTDPLAGRRT